MVRAWVMTAATSSLLWQRAITAGERSIIWLNTPRATS